MKGHTQWQEGIEKDRENILQKKFSRTKPSVSIHADATVLMKKIKWDAGFFSLYCGRQYL